MAGRADGPIGQDGVDVATTGPNPLEVILVVAPFVVPLAAAIYLGVRLRAGAPTTTGLGFGTLEQEPAAFSIAGRQVRRGPARTASCAASTAR
jgi:hypothetical protein